MGVEKIIVHDNSVYNKAAEVLELLKTVKTEIVNTKKDVEQIKADVVQIKEDVAVKES